MIQGALFPEAFEIQARAFAALEELDVAAALELVNEARELDPALVNLEPLQAALVWLRRESSDGPVTDDLLALLFLTVPEAARSGELTPEAAALVDEVLALRGLAGAKADEPFLDGEERVHRGFLLLVRRRFHEARALLGASLGVHADRADLWAAFGDASFALEREDEAGAAWVRALVLAARDVDPYRLRHEPLRTLHRDLAALHGDACARELLLVHAWLAGVLRIPPENCWLDGHLSRLALAAALRPGAPPELRLRRFALLFYLDRSRPSGHYDEAERAEMQSLDPELFALVLQRIQALEKTRTSALRW